MCMYTRTYAHTRMTPMSVRQIFLGQSDVVLYTGKLFSTCYATTEDSKLGFA